MPEAISQDIDRIYSSTEGYVPRITEDLVFYHHPACEEFSVLNIWVHEDGDTYVRFTTEGKSLCCTAEKMRERFKNGEFEVVEE